MYDLIIIGGGPGGTAGAVYAARKQLKTLMLTSEFGGQSSVSEDIKNWIGTISISGADLAKSFKAHVVAHTGPYLDLKEGAKVAKIEKMPDNTFTVTTENDESFQSKTVLITAGSEHRKLTIEGADTYENKGITYCASCDGPLFSGQDVAVIGGGNAAFESALQLQAYCKTVTIINRSDKFRADPETVEKVLAKPNIKVRKNVEMLAVVGEQFVTGLKIKDTTTGVEETLPLGGIFVEIGQIPNSALAKGLVEVNDQGKIVIDPWTQRTSVEGIWAAGDVTNILYHQNNIAAGDAVRALENIYQWVAQR